MRAHITTTPTTTNDMVTTCIHTISDVAKRTTAEPSYQGQHSAQISNPIFPNSTDRRRAPLQQVCHDIPTLADNIIHMSKRSTTELFHQWGHATYHHEHDNFHLKFIVGVIMLLTTTTTNTTKATNDWRPCHGCRNPSQRTTIQRATTTTKTATLGHRTM